MKLFILSIFTFLISSSVFSQEIQYSIKCKAINYVGYVHGLDLRALELNLFKFSRMPFVELLQNGQPIKDSLNRLVYSSQEFHQAASFSSDIDFATWEAAADSRPWGQVMIRFSPRRGDGVGFPALVRFSEYAEVKFICVQ
ncbi:MAG TPA: hypothetical protein VNJ01_17565 [Bacteriovoracaceae bacterium]|nr:hypothetical protein [Bacteriovoracaceae bacterium]